INEVESSDLADMADELSFDEPSIDTTLNRHWDEPQPAVSRKRRNPWIIGGGVALLAIGILVTVVLIGGSRSTIPTPRPSPPALLTPEGMGYVAGGEVTMGSATCEEWEGPGQKVKVARLCMD